MSIIDILYEAVQVIENFKEKVLAICKSTCQFYCRNNTCTNVVKVLPITLLRDSTLKEDILEPTFEYCKYCRKYRCNCPVNENVIAELDRRNRIIKLMLQ